jgi:pilus assembly protein CpaE
MDRVWQEPPAKIRILIVDDNKVTVDSVACLLQFEHEMEVIGWAPNGRVGVQKAQELRPDIVLMDINMPDMDGIEACRQIGSVSPRSRVTMMSVQGDMAYFKRAMNVGAREFLTKPFDYDDLIQTIRRVAAAAVTPLELQAEAELAAVQSSNGKGPSARARGLLIAVFGPKGGIGCSTVSANLAVALRGSRRADVLLVDGDLAFGDLDVLLDLHPAHRMQEALKQGDPEDVDLVQQMEVAHYSGLHLLAAPPRPEMAELIRADDFVRLMESLRRVHDYLVVDVGSRYSDLAQRVFDLADRVVWLVTPEVTTIKNAHLLLTSDALRDYPPDKLIAVLNKYSDVWGVTPDAVSKAMGRPIALIIPADDAAAVLAANQGRPVLLSTPRSPITRSLLALERLIPSRPDPESRTEPVAVPRMDLEPASPRSPPLVDRLIEWARRQSWNRWLSYLQIPSLRNRFGF